MSHPAAVNMSQNNQGSSSSSCELPDLSSVLPNNTSTSPLCFVYMHAKIQRHHKVNITRRNAACWLVTMFPVRVDEPPRTSILQDCLRPDVQPGGGRLSLKSYNEF